MDASLQGICKAFRSSRGDPSRCATQLRTSSRTPSMSRPGAAATAASSPHRLHHPALQHPPVLPFQSCGPARHILPSPLPRLQPCEPATDPRLQQYPRSRSHDTRTECCCSNKTAYSETVAQTAKTQIGNANAPTSLSPEYFTKRIFVATKLCVMVRTPRH